MVEGYKKLLMFGILKPHDILQSCMGWKSRCVKIFKCRVFFISFTIWVKNSLKYGFYTRFEYLLFIERKKKNVTRFGKVIKICTNILI